VVGVGRFKETRGLHHAVPRELINDQVHEADLADAEFGVGQVARLRLPRA